MSPAAGSTFGDVLRILPSKAREALVQGLFRTDLPRARLACRDLRDVIDSQVTDLDVDLEAGALAVHVRMSQDGHWLCRWPCCTKVTFRASGRGRMAVAAILASTPAEACRRIKEFALVFSPMLDRYRAEALLEILSYLPSLQSLQLMLLVPCGSQELALASHALSLLPCMSSLALAEESLLACLPDDMAGRLTSLTLSYGDRARPPAPVLIAAVGRLTCLRELVILADVGDHNALSHEGLLALLDAAAPPLRSLLVTHVGNEYLETRFELSAAGALEAVHLTTDDSPSSYITYAAIAALLTEAVLPSRVMGPRMRLLELGQLSPQGLLSDPGAAMGFFARCDRVELPGLMMEPGREGAVELARLLGLPRLLLRSQIEAAITLHGRGNEASRTSLPPALSAPEVVQRALQRMDSGPGPGASSVILRGSLVRGLMVFPAALSAWLQQLSKQVQGAAPAGVNSPRIGAFRRLPSAGAVALSCIGPAAAEAVAAAAQRLAEEARGNTCCDAGAAAFLDVRLCQWRWEDAVQQVLQALWDGEEDEALPAGEQAPPEGSNGRASRHEQQRMDRLLDTCEAIKGLPYRELLSSR
ncbi:hypothetical protein HYH03_000569 [Edaphochlamys debaryana]|uniref:Uncharacterized protein n=1 Tax=Edaphochlamys debaryana TaxID=47281 RepID=A0A836C6B2_9CHLO|nr:hypothetical protein HYH03_000569 [Edaphochlamys debaryana]|eukprot:KAG2502076.1 hypothetical protein HYH03_000569 [Edaphochlamys debaryana]